MKDLRATNRKQKRRGVTRDVPEARNTKKPRWEETPTGSESSDRKKKKAQTTTN
jgi:hypothetical protein